MSLEAQKNRRVFGSGRENLKPRTKAQQKNRIAVLAKQTYQHIGISGEEMDYREELKMRCAVEQIPYDSALIEQALWHARRHAR